eukprot:365696-Chlamydomonas_euryale.AAC.9
MAALPAALPLTARCSTAAQPRRAASAGARARPFRPAAAEGSPPPAARPASCAARRQMLASRGSSRTAGRRAVRASPRSVPAPQCAATAAPAPPRGREARRLPRHPARRAARPAPSGTSAPRPRAAAPPARLCRRVHPPPSATSAAAPAPAGWRPRRGHPATAPAPLRRQPPPPRAPAACYGRLPGTQPATAGTAPRSTACWRADPPAAAPVAAPHRRPARRRGAGRCGQTSGAATAERPTAVLHHHATARQRRRGRRRACEGVWPTAGPHPRLNVCLRRGRRSACLPGSALRPHSQSCPSPGSSHWVVQCELLTEPKRPPPATHTPAQGQAVSKGEGNTDKAKNEAGKEKILAVAQGMHPVVNSRSENHRADNKKPSLCVYLATVRGQQAQKAIGRERLHGGHAALQEHQQRTRRHRPAHCVARPAEWDACMLKICHNPMCLRMKPGEAGMIWAGRLTRRGQAGWPDIAAELWCVEHHDFVNTESGREADASAISLLRYILPSQVHVLPPENLGMFPSIGAGIRIQDQNTRSTELLAIFRLASIRSTVFQSPLGRHSAARHVLGGRRNFLQQRHAFGKAEAVVEFVTASAASVTAVATAAATVAATASAAGAAKAAAAAAAAAVLTAAASAAAASAAPTAAIAATVAAAADVQLPIACGEATLGHGGLLRSHQLQQRVVLPQQGRCTWRVGAAFGAAHWPPAGHAASGSGPSGDTLDARAAKGVAAQQHQRAPRPLIKTLQAHSALHGHAVCLKTPLVSNGQFGC